jgi:hypothetical protein
MQMIDTAAAKWREEEATLREELREAKLNSNQNLDGLREELRQSEVCGCSPSAPLHTQPKLSIDKLSKDHSSFMRQAHRRQEELERANSDLVRNLVEKDREVKLPIPPLSLNSSCSSLPAVCRSSGSNKRMRICLSLSPTSRRSADTRNRSSPTPLPSLPLLFPPPPSLIFLPCALRSRHFHQIFRN